MTAMVSLVSMTLQGAALAPPAGITLAPAAVPFADLLDAAGVAGPGTPGPSVAGPGRVAEPVAVRDARPDARVTVRKDATPDAEADTATDRAPDTDPAATVVLPAAGMPPVPVTVPVPVPVTVPTQVASAMAGLLPAPVPAQVAATPSRASDPTDTVVAGAAASPVRAVDAQPATWQATTSAAMSQPATSPAATSQPAAATSQPAAATSQPAAAQSAPIQQGVTQPRVSQGNAQPASPPAVGVTAPTPGRPAATATAHDAAATATAHDAAATATAHDAAATATAHDAAATADVVASERPVSLDASVIVAMPVPAQLAVVTPPVAPPAVTAALPPELPQPALAGAISRLRRGPDGVHQLEVALHPADLGSVRVRVTISHGTLDVTVACADPAARDAVTAALPALHRDLAGLGRVDVTGERQPADSSFAGSQRDRSTPDNPDQSSRHHPRRQQPAPDDDFDRWM